jgi:hypothetical protein
MRSKSDERIWVILRTTQYIRHLVVDAYFASQADALDYMNKFVAKGAIALPLELSHGEKE